jgi:hypothetical protein
VLDVSGEMRDVSGEMRDVSGEMLALSWTMRSPACETLDARRALLRRSGTELGPCVVWPGARHVVATRAVPRCNLRGASLSAPSAVPSGPPRRDARSPSE